MLSKFWIFKYTLLCSTNILDIYSIVSSRNVPLGIGLLAQCCLYNIIVKDSCRSYNHNHMRTFYKLFPYKDKSTRRLWKDSTEQIREGCRKKNAGKVWSFTNPPSDPPPGLVFFPKKNWPPFFLLKISSTMAKTNFSPKKKKLSKILPNRVVIW